MHSVLYGGDKMFARRRCRQQQQRLRRSNIVVARSKQSEEKLKSINSDVPVKLIRP